MKCALVLVCAGKGERLKSKVDKAFVKIGNLPLFYYSYQVFKGIKGFSQIIVVAKKRYFAFIRRYIKDERLFLTEGGKRRQDSVYKGLQLVDDGVGYVFVHDGARPFVTKNLIVKLKKEVLRFGAVVPGVKVSEAVKVVRRERIKKTLDRSNIWYIQTPQAFKKNLLIEAYRKFRRVSVYDDAQLVSLLNVPVKVIEGEHLNIKITYPHDLFLAKAILKIGMH